MRSPFASIAVFTLAAAFLGSGSADAGGVAWYGELSGSKVVPANPTAAAGIGYFTKDATSIHCHLYATFHFGTARIHSGAPGTNGPTIGVIPLDSLGEWLGTSPATPSNLADLEANHLYAEISALQTSDVIRGQITMTWSTFGAGCAGAAGIPSIQGGVVPKPGSTISISGSGGAPNAPALLFVHTLAANVPLPGGCTLLVDPSAPIVLPLVLGATGGFSTGSVVLPLTLPTPLDVHMQMFVFDPTAANHQYTATARFTMHATSFPD